MRVTPCQRGMTLLETVLALLAVTVVIGLAWAGYSYFAR